MRLREVHLTRESQLEHVDADLAVDSGSFETAAHSASDGTLLEVAAVTGQEVSLVVRASLQLSEKRESSAGAAHKTQEDLLLRVGRVVGTQESVRLVTIWVPLECI